MRKNSKIALLVLGGVGIKNMLRSPEEKELRILFKEQIKDLKLQIKNNDITKQEGEEQILDVKNQLKKNILELKKSERELEDSGEEDEDEDEDEDEE